ncbi:hypothetical protein H0H93_003915 [Arthromyces matolae]|nr:hypothetical protein H0H93_003915 [Arthromyces matolae]
MASLSQPPKMNGATESTPLLSETTNPLAKPDTDDASNEVMFRQELITIPRYSLPVFGSQLLEFSIVLVPVISIGHMSTTALAAVSLGSMTANVTGFSILQGLSSGLDTVLPSAWTSSQPQLVGLWSQRMAVIMAFALVPIYVIWFNAEPLLLSMKQDPEVARLAALYLRWYSISLPAFALNCIGRRYFQSQGHFYIQTRILFISAPINVLLNYLLVWGPEFVRLGFIGAPIASALTLCIVSLTSFIHGAYLIPQTAWHPLSVKMFSNLGILLRLGLSGIGQLASEWWAWELVALAASWFGPVALASQSILISTSALVFQLGYAIANATTVRIGNLLGERNARRAEYERADYSVNNPEELHWALAVLQEDEVQEGPCWQVIDRHYRDGRVEWSIIYQPVRLGKTMKCLGGVCVGRVEADKLEEMKQLILNSQPVIKFQGWNCRDWIMEVLLLLKHHGFLTQDVPDTQSGLLIYMRQAGPKTLERRRRGDTTVKIVSLTG